MPSFLCSVRVHLPRALFRKLMIQAILEQTDLNTIVVRAVCSELHLKERGRAGGLRGQRKMPRP